MNIEPKSPYVYQPYGALSHKERGERLFGVAGVSLDANITGLTRREAEAVYAVLTEMKGKSNEG